MKYFKAYISTLVSLILLLFSLIFSKDVSALTCEGLFNSKKLELKSSQKSNSLYSTEVLDSLDIKVNFDRLTITPTSKLILPEIVRETNPDMHFSFNVLIIKYLKNNNQFINDIMFVQNNSKKSSFVLLTQVKDVGQSIYKQATKDNLNKNMLWLFTEVDPSGNSSSKQKFTSTLTGITFEIESKFIN